MRLANFKPGSYLRSRGFLLPTALGFVFVLSYGISFHLGEAKYFSFKRALFQWDGQHYLSIARDGYEKFPCPYNADYICGNIGWFPFYPLVGKGVAVAVGPLGFDVQTALIATSWLALWLALLVLYRLVEGRFDARVATVSLMALLLFPSSFYFLTGFPYALYLLLAVLIFYLLERERFWVVALLTGPLAVTYPSGLVIGLPILYVLVSGWSRLGWHKKGALMASLVAIGLALLLYAGYYWWKFDDFLLYQRFQAQSYYAHRLTLPFIPIVRTLLRAPLNDPVKIMLLFTLPVVVLSYGRRVPVSWQLFLFAVLLFTPGFGTTACYYRHVVVAFPLAVMVGLLIQASRRRYLLIPYVLAALVLAWKVFFALYKAGDLM